MQIRPRTSRFALTGSHVAASGLHNGEDESVFLQQSGRVSRVFEKVRSFPQEEQKKKGRTGSRDSSRYLGRQANIFALILGRLFVFFNLLQSIFVNQSLCNPSDIPTKEMTILTYIVRSILEKKKEKSIQRHRIWRDGKK